MTKLPRGVPRRWTWLVVGQWASTERLDNPGLLQEQIEKHGEIVIALEDILTVAAALCYVVQQPPAA